MSDKVDKIVDMFLCSYYSWTETKQKQSIKSLSFYVNDYIRTVYEGINDEEFEELYNKVMTELKKELKRGE